MIIFCNFFLKCKVKQFLTSLLVASPTDIAEMAVSLALVLAMLPEFHRPLHHLP